MNVPFAAAGSWPRALAIAVASDFGGHRRLLRGALAALGDLRRVGEDAAQHRRRPCRRVAIAVSAVLMPRSTMPRRLRGERGHFVGTRVSRLASICSLAIDAVELGGAPGASHACRTRRAVR